MPVVAISFVGESDVHSGYRSAWPDLVDKQARGELIFAANDIAVTGLSDGMQSGKPSVAFRFDLPDGRTVLAETSLQLVLTVADALRGRFGDPR